MKKRLLLLAALLCLTASLSGCSSDTKEETTAAQTAQTAETEQTASEAETVEESSETAAETETEAETRPQVVKEDYDPLQYVDLGEYKGIQVSRADIDVDDATLEDTLNSELAQYSYTQEVTDRPVQEGDTVNIDYTGTLNGEAFDGGSDEGASLTIGSGRFIDGFEDGLIGVAAGETVDLNLTFPEEYSSNPDLAGQAVVFEVTVNSITETVVPELTDEFAQEHSAYQTAEEFREGLRSVMRDQNKRTAVMDALMQQAQFQPMPENLIDYYESEMISQMEYQAAMYGMTYENLLAAYGMTEEEFLEMSAENVESNARQDVLLNAIIASEQMELTDEEFQAGAQELADSYGLTADDVISALGEDLLRENLLWNKAIDFVTQQAVETE